MKDDLTLPVIFKLLILPAFLGYNSYCRYSNYATAKIISPKMFCARPSFKKIAVVLYVSPSHRTNEISMFAYRIYCKTQ